MINFTAHFCNVAWVVLSYSSHNSLNMCSIRMFYSLDWSICRCLLFHFYLTRLIFNRKVIFFIPYMVSPFHISLAIEISTLTTSDKNWSSSNCPSSRFSKHILKSRCKTLHSNDSISVHINRIPSQWYIMCSRFFKSFTYTTHSWG